MEAVKEIKIKLTAEDMARLQKLCNYHQISNMSEIFRLSLKESAIRI